MPARSCARTVAAAVALAVAALPTAFAADASSDAVELQYNHREGTWTVTLPDDMEMAAGYPGAPTVFVRQGEKVKVCIVDTNPLLYAITSVTVKEEDTQLLKSLQDLASLLGKVVETALKVPPGQPKGGGQPPPDAVKLAMKKLQFSLNRIRDQLNTLALARDNAMLLMQRAEFPQLPSSEYDHSIWDQSGAPTLASYDPTPKIKEVVSSFSELREAKVELESLAYLIDPETTTGLASGLDPILKAADELLSKSDDARKAAANLVAFDLRRKAAAEAGWQIAVPTPATGARWDKSQQYTIELKADSPYAVDIARNPQLKDVTLTYTVRWSGESVLGVGVGVTYTPVVDHTWAALPLPSDPKKLSPQVKTTETRAGQVALFLNWRAVQTFWPGTRTWKAKPGIEVGATLNTDKLGAYVGVSLEVLKALRIAYGRTWQRVTVLDGQVAGVTVVQSEADVRTRQTFTPSWYASFSFALDSLTLFKKD
jgi:hypothetical protein